VSDYVSGSVRPYLGTTATFGTAVTANGTYTARFGPGAGGEIGFNSTSAFTGSIDNFSIKALTGNHATQATTANRPNYGVVPATGRRNLLTWTEDFSNAAWSTGGLSLSAGSSSASQIITATTTNGSLLRFVSVSPNAVVCTNSIEIRRITGTGPIELKLPGNGGNPITVTSNWTRFSSSGPAGGPFDYYLLQIATIGDALEIRYPQAELGSTATAYQKVTNQYGVTEAGVTSCGYLFFDGVNDSMVTSTITPGTDKAQVFAGVRKNSDATGQILYEFSPSVVANANSLAMYAGNNATAQGALWTGQNRGNGAAVSAEYNAVAGAPVSTVLTAQFAIQSTPRTVIRANGSVIGTLTGAADTGNFGNWPLYLGARNQSSLFYSGLLFPLIVRFGPNLTAARILSTELWVGERTSEVDIPKSISPNIYTRSGDTILDRANSIIERRTV